ncbi:MAG TPA: peptide deformylase [Clostridiales bacterium]|nr:peptide deformylase [Clostridiales bacterium]
MALRNIVKKGDPILLKKSRPVEKFDDRLATLIDDMAETMYDGNGVGLAAVQVGVLKRVFVADTGDGLREFVNPVIFDEEGEQNEIEGCLSVPGESGVTKRPQTVKIKAQDRHGKWHIYKVQGLDARCYCHENDHLDGILFTQRLVEEPAVEDI